jgi:hypothetical protein
LIRHVFLSKTAILDWKVETGGFTWNLVDVISFVLTEVSNHGPGFEGSENWKLFGLLAA